MQHILNRLGLVCNVGKGCWEGSRQIDHLGVNLESSTIRVYVSDQTVCRVRGMARGLLSRTHRNHRLVMADHIWRFCGTCVSLTLALPISRVFTCFIFFDLSRVGRAHRAQSLQRKAGAKQWWGQVTRGRERELQPAAPQFTMHSDTSDV